MFDQDTGQVYTEWSVPRDAISEQADLNAIDWSRRRPYQSIKLPGARGPRSLVDMAINVLADNIDRVEAGDLDCLPNRIVWRIWRFLEARGVCLHAWKLLFKTLVDQGDDKQNLGLHRFRQHICRPGNDLRKYIQPLLSPSTDFVAHLVLTGGCTFSTNDLLCLSDMSNLGILELIQPADELRAVFPEVTNRLIRGWTEKTDPFPLLRILRIFGDQSVTQDSMQWVSKFPSLVLYDVMGSREDWNSPDVIASREGWKRVDSSHGLEGSLLQYLMMFAPLEETRINRLREVARGIDSDLVSLCSDSRCAVQFVAERGAPLLLDYLTDGAKAQIPSWNPDAARSEVRACHWVPFEAWAFWLYSLIGQLSDDRDLAARGVLPENQAVVGPFVLPSKPLACLYLGHSARGGISSMPSYVSRGLFATRRYTFKRDMPIHKANKPWSKKAPKTEAKMTSSGPKAPSLALRHRKRKRLDDVLQSFSR